MDIHTHEVVEKGLNRILSDLLTMTISEKVEGIEEENQRTLLKQYTLLLTEFFTVRSSSCITVV